MTINHINSLSTNVFYKTCWINCCSAIMQRTFISDVVRCLYDAGQKCWMSIMILYRLTYTLFFYQFSDILNHNSTSFHSTPLIQVQPYISEQIRKWHIIVGNGLKFLSNNKEHGLPLQSNTGDSYGREANHGYIVYTTVHSYQPLNY